MDPFNQKHIIFDLSDGTVVAEKTLDSPDGYKKMFRRVEKRLNLMIAINDAGTAGKLSDGRTFKVEVFDGLLDTPDVTDWKAKGIKAGEIIVAEEDSIENVTTHVFPSQEARFDFWAGVHAKTMDVWSKAMELSLEM